MINAVVTFVIGLIIGACLMIGSYLGAQHLSTACNGTQAAVYYEYR